MAQIFRSEAMSTDRNQIPPLRSPHIFADTLSYLLGDTEAPFIHFRPSPPQASGASSYPSSKVHNTPRTSPVGVTSPLDSAETQAPTTQIL